LFQNTIFALLPYLGLWVMVMASGGGADRLQSHGVLSTTATRKIMQLIGEFNQDDSNDSILVKRSHWGCLGAAHLQICSLSPLLPKNSNAIFTSFYDMHGNVSSCFPRKMFLPP